MRIPKNIKVVHKTRIVHITYNYADKDLCLRITLLSTSGCFVLVQGNRLVTIALSGVKNHNSGIVSLPSAM